MKKIIFLLFFAIFFFSGTAFCGVSDYEGNYNGAYSSNNEMGVWFMHLDSNGKISGVVWSENHNDSPEVNGSISQSGSFTMNADNGTIISGTIYSETISGNWNNSYGESGTVYGSKSITPDDDRVKQFSGDYSGPFSGSDSGWWSMYIDPQGYCEGNILSSSTQQSEQASGGIDPAGNFVFVTEDGTALKGTIAFSRGIKSGIWKNTKRNQSGTLSGSAEDSNNIPAEVTADKNSKSSSGCFVMTIAN